MQGVSGEESLAGKESLAKSLSRGRSLLQGKSLVAIDIVAAMIRVLVRRIVVFIVIAIALLDIVVHDFLPTHSP